MVIISIRRVEKRGRRRREFIRLVIYPQNDPLVENPLTNLGLRPWNTTMGSLKKPWIYRD
jgi:hypothetical protein